MKNSKKTVLHLSAVHALKAVSGIISKHVTDKGQREFLTSVFARLQNTTTLDEVTKVFRALCIILRAKKLTCCKIQCWGADKEDTLDCTTTVGKSPFSSFFRRIYDDAAEAMESEPNEEEENMYYCPALLQILLHKYMSRITRISTLEWVDVGWPRKTQ